MTAADNAAETALVHPIDSLTWHSLFFAEGALFDAEGYADAGAVGTWPNETGESDATQATGGKQPLYFDAITALNGRPGITFDGANDILQSAAFSANPSYTSGVTVVAITSRDDVGSTEKLFDGIVAGNRNAIYKVSTNWRIFAGTTERSGGTVVADQAVLLTGFFDGSTGNDTLDVDGTNIIDASSGSHTLTGATIGGDYSDVQFWDGDVALVGIIEGDPATDSPAAWGKFLEWVEAHYGIGIA